MNCDNGDLKRYESLYLLVISEIGEGILDVCFNVGERRRGINWDFVEYSQYFSIMEKVMFVLVTFDLSKAIFLQCSLLYVGFVNSKLSNQ